MVAVTYRRPGVYLEESLLVNRADVTNAVTVAAFVGVASKGPVNRPILLETWSDYVSVFGGFDLVPPTDPNNVSERIAGAPTASKASLATLKTDTTWGDAKFHLAPPAGAGGSVFTAGQYAYLNDGTTKVSYVGTTWSAGQVAGTGVPLTSTVLSYLPYAVYTYYQNGGRFAYVIRSAPPDTGALSTATVAGDPSGTAFKFKSRSVGVWGNDLEYELINQSVDVDDTGQNVFQLVIRYKDEIVERFQNLSMSGQLSGTRRIDVVVNDANIGSGSRYVLVTDLSTTVQPADTVTTVDDSDVSTPVALAGGTDPDIPGSDDLEESCAQLTEIEGPINVNIVGYLSDASKVNSTEFASKWVGGTIDDRAVTFPDREDIFIINDNAPPRNLEDSSGVYAGTVKSDLSTGIPNDSYMAAYTPWVTIPNPVEAGATIYIPPGGAVLGVMARIDATVGPFRAPAGTIAAIANAVGVQTKFTDTELGDLNESNINVIRSIVGSGICVMGARTRKTYGVDRYVSARRVLIFLKETLRRSTQWAVFENNDERLWSALSIAADRVIRPLWEVGGLRGTTAADAYFIRCDETLNTDQVIASGEVRMEIGVALEYPAEFVIIKITQFEQGTFTAEVQPLG